MTQSTLLKKVTNLGLLSTVATAKMGAQMTFAQDSSSAASSGGFLTPKAVSVRGGLASTDKLGSGFFGFEVEDEGGTLKVGSENNGLYAGASLYGGNNQWDWRLSSEIFNAGQSGLVLGGGIPDPITIDLDNSYSDIAFDIGKTFGSGNLKARLYLGGTYIRHKSNVLAFDDDDSANVIISTSGFGGHVGAALDYQITPQFSLYGNLEHASIGNANTALSKVGEEPSDGGSTSVDMLTWDFGVGYQLTPMAKAEMGVTGKKLGFDAPFDLDKLQAYYIGLNVKF